MRHGRFTVAMAAMVLLGGCSSAKRAVTDKPPPPPEYVALGDSYTSGPLLPDPVGVAGCLRSNHNYATIVAGVLGARPYRDVSCSGATTEDLATAQVTANGTNPPQFEALTASTTVVSIGIGGNDLGFGEITTRCSSPLPVGTPCQQQFVVGGRDVLDERIAQTSAKLVAAFASIHLRAPRARIFAVGYPSIVPATGTGCWPQVPFTPGDVPFLRAKLEALNEATRTAASASRVTYVEVYQPSAGHDACQVPATRWVEPLVPAGTGLALHPNPAGMAATAAVLAAAIRAAA